MIYVLLKAHSYHVLKRFNLTLKFYYFCSGKGHAFMESVTCTILVGFTTFWGGLISTIFDTMVTKTRNYHYDSLACDWPHWD